MNPTQQRILVFIAELELQHGKAHPRRRSLAGALGISEATVKRSIRALKAAGLLKVSTRRTRSRKQLTSLYALTEAGKAIVRTTTPGSVPQTVFGLSDTLNEGGRGSAVPTTRGSWGAQEQATRGSVENTPSAPTQTQDQGGRGSQETTTPGSDVTPLNKEQPETTGGGPEESAALEGRPLEPPPHMLTKSPAANQYIRDQWAARAKREPTGLDKQMEILRARWAKRGDA